MSKAASKEFLEELHSEMAKDLLKKIKSGKATAADIQAARQFLRDNGISAIAKPNSNALGDLAEALPFSPNDEDPDYIN